MSTMATSIDGPDGDTVVKYSPLQATAGIGFAIWFSYCVAGGFVAPTYSMIGVWFLLAPLVVVPLGWNLSVVRQQVGNDPIFRVARWLVLPAAMVLTGSFLLPVGAFAATLAVPWFLLCSMAAFAAGRELLRRKAFDLSALIPSAALLMTPIGAAWAIASRAGWGPMGFTEPIILLTAVHFHYAAFAAPLIAAMVATRLVRRLAFARGIHQAASVGLVIGVPMLAAGFVVSPMLKFVAALILAVSLVVIAATQILVATSRACGASSCLMRVSSVCVVAGMGLSTVYAFGEYAGLDLISIPKMAVLHGLMNGVGFALCGILAWQEWSRPPASCTLSG